MTGGAGKRRGRRRFELDALPVAVLLSDRSDRIVFLNQEARTLFGPGALNSNVRNLCDARPGTPIKTPQEIRRMLAQSAGRTARDVMVSARTHVEGRIVMLASFAWDHASQSLLTCLLRHRADVSKVLEKLSLSLAAGESTERLLQRITEEASKLCGGHRSYIKLLDAARTSLVIRGLYPADSVICPRSSPVDRGMTGYVFRTRTAYRSDDVTKEPAERYFDLFQDTRAKVVVPILSGGRDGGECLGVLAVDGREVAQFGVDSIQILSSLAAQVAIVLEHLALSRELRAVVDEVLAGTWSATGAQDAAEALHTAKNQIDACREMLIDVRDGIRAVDKATLSATAARLLAASLQLKDIRERMRTPTQRPARPIESPTQPSLFEIATRVLRLAALGEMDVEVSFESERNEVGPDLHYVYGRNSELNTLLYNVVENAIHAAQLVERGRVRVRLSSPLIDIQRVEVEDNGPGIDSTTLKCIESGRPISTREGGWGQGLLIAGDIVRRLGGKITFHAGSGGVGTMVRLDIPSPSASGG